MIKVGDWPRLMLIPLFWGFCENLLHFYFFFNMSSIFHSSKKSSPDVSFFFCLIIYSVRFNVSLTKYICYKTFEIHLQIFIYVCLFNNPFHQYALKYYFRNLYYLFISLVIKHISRLYILWSLQLYDIILAFICIFTFSTRKVTNIISLSSVHLLVFPYVVRNVRNFFRN